MCRFSSTFLSTGRTALPPFLSSSSPSFASPAPPLVSPPAALSQRAFALEASLLGVVAGSFRHASAACVSWEDRCWALLRCAIEAAADAAADEHAPVGERAILDGLMQPAGEGRDGLVAAAAPGGWPAPEITGQVSRVEVKSKPRRSS